LVSGTVVHHAHFGVFIDFGHPVIKGLIERTEFSDESNRDIAQESLFPGIGKQVTGVVVGYSKHNNELRISMRPSMMQKFKEGHS
jgi:ribosomal protein S1